MINRYDAMAPKESNGKTFWLKVGSAWLNKSGNGYTVVLDAMPAPVDGAFRFSLFEPKENNNGSASSGGTSQNSSGSKRPTANIPEDEIPF